MLPGIVYQRNLTVASDIIVTVISHNSWTGKNYRSEARLIHSAPKIKHSKVKTFPQKYQFDIPGLTQAQTTARASQLLKELSKNEVPFSFDMIGDVELHKSNVVKCVDTQTAFDQVYYINAIRRTLSAAPPSYFMSVDVKNVNTRSQLVVQ